MPTPGAVNCGDFWTWPPNIFNPDCYAITAAKLFGDPAQKAAAYGATSPEVMYAPIAQPPAPGAPSGPALTIPPADGQDAAATIDRILARQLASWKAQNTDAMQETAGNIEAAGKQPGIFGSSTTWLLIAAAVFAALLILEKRK